MPRLLVARPPRDELEARQVRKLAGSRHAPGDWALRARMVVLSWEGLRVPAIAAELRCHPQTVRERLVRFTAEGLEGLGDRPGPGRKPRLTEPERGTSPTPPPSPRATSIAGPSPGSGGGRRPRRGSSGASSSTTFEEQCTRQLGRSQWQST
jgi:hypothetical protein